MLAARCWLPAARVLAAKAPGPIWLRKATGRPIRSFAGDFDFVHGAAVAPGGKILGLVTGYDHNYQIHLFDLGTGKELRRVATRVDLSAISTLASVNIATATTNSSGQYALTVSAGLAAGAM